MTILAILIVRYLHRMLFRSRLRFVKTMIKGKKHLLGRSAVLYLERRVKRSSCGVASAQGSRLFGLPAASSVMTTRSLLPAPVGGRAVGGRAVGGRLGGGWEGGDEGLT